MDPQAIEETYEQRHLHYMLFRALTRTAEGRPRLPPELVVLIFRAAAITSREGSRSDVASGQAIRVSSSYYGGRAERKDWFATPPLTSAALRRLAAVRLYTTSRDQGWADRPEFETHTWFELCIAWPVVGADGNAHVAIAERADGTLLSWISHRDNPVAKSTPREQRGHVFGPEHELWDHLRAGHVILVRACAQFAAWSNTAMDGALRFTTFFEPTASLVDVD